MRKINKFYGRAIGLHRWCRRVGLERVKDYPPVLQLLAKYYYCPLTNANPDAGVICNYDTRRLQVTFRD